MKIYKKKKLSIYLYKNKQQKTKTSKNVIIGRQKPRKDPRRMPPDQEQTGTGERDGRQKEDHGKDSTGLPSIGKKRLHHALLVFQVGHPDSGQYTPSRKKAHSQIQAAYPVFIQA